MNVFGYVLLCLAALAAPTIAVGLFMWVMLVKASQKNTYATTLTSSTFKFLVKGGECYLILEDLQDAFVDQISRLVKKEGDPGQKRVKGALEELIGIIWVSITHPAKKVHTFNVVVDKLKPGHENMPVREQIKEGIREVDYLLYRFPHPILIKDVELGKTNWRVDLIAIVNIRVVNPFTVVFDFEGTVMTQIDAAVRSAVMDYLNEPHMDYQQFVAEDKGAESDLAKAILKLNESTSPKAVSDGIGIQFGVEIESTYIQAADLTPDSKKQQEAAQAKETARLLAEAKIEEAKGNKVAARLLQEGEGQGLKAKMKSLTDQGLTPKEAADLIRDDIKYGNIAKAGLSTLVDGGGTVTTLPIK